MPKAQTIQGDGDEGEANATCPYGNDLNRVQGENESRWHWSR